MNIIKKILIVFLVLASSAANAQFSVTIKWEHIKSGNTGDTINYDTERKLNWNDFKGNPDMSSAAAAITESGFGYRMSMESYNQKTNVIITVFCYFNKRRSWVKKDMDNAYALLHEQHHFDITYINTFVFVQKLKAARFNKENYSDLIDKINDECFNALNKMQNDYDGQTLNGRIKHMQTTWNKKIDQQLALIIN